MSDHEKLIDPILMELLMDRTFSDDFERDYKLYKTGELKPIKISDIEIIERKMKLIVDKDEKLD